MVLSTQGKIFPHLSKGMILSMSHVTSSKKCNELAEKTVQITNRNLEEVKSWPKKKTLHAFLENRDLYTKSQVKIHSIATSRIRRAASPNSWATESREIETKRMQWPQCRTPPPPPVGESITYQEGKTLNIGIVTKEDEDRLYKIENKEGGGNRWHLMQTNEKCEPNIPWSYVSYHMLVLRNVPSHPLSLPLLLNLVYQSQKPSPRPIRSTRPQTPSLTLLVLLKHKVFSPSFYFICSWAIFIQKIQEERKYSNIRT